MFTCPNRVKHVYSTSQKWPVPDDKSPGPTLKAIDLGVVVVWAGGGGEYI